jgi:hypothetical protein
MKKKSIAAVAPASIHSYPLEKKKKKKKRKKKKEKHLPTERKPYDKDETHELTGGDEQ